MHRRLPDLESRSAFNGGTCAAIIRGYYAPAGPIADRSTVAEDVPEYKVTERCILTFIILLTIISYYEITVYRTI